MRKTSVASRSGPGIWLSKKNQNAAVYPRPKFTPNDIHAGIRRAVIDNQHFDTVRQLPEHRIQAFMHESFNFKYRNDDAQQYIHYNSLQ